MSLVMPNISLNCSICTEDYTQQRKPIVLPCDHTFCEFCVKAVKNCFLDRKPFGECAINYAVYGAIDPGSSIERKKEEIVAQVKHGPTVARMPSEDASLVVQLNPQRSLEELRRNEENRLAWVDQQLRPLLNTSDGYPQSMERGDGSAMVHLLNKMIRNNAHMPDLCIRAKCLLAILYWAQNMSHFREEIRYDYCRQEIPRSLFFEVAESPHASQEDKTLSRFAFCLLELNRDTSDQPNYLKVRTYLETIEREPRAPSVHRSMARFYLALLSLKGLGGLQPSYEHAKERLLQLAEDQNLDPGLNLNGFAILMLAELHLLGLGGLEKNPSRAINLLQTCSPGIWGGRTSAKIYYWVGVLYKNGTPEFPANKIEAKKFLSQGCRAVGLQEDDSIEKMQDCLENVFKSKNVYEPAHFDAEPSKGPYYEEYLDLHLDPNRYANRPERQAPLPSDCVIL